MIEAAKLARLRRGLLVTALVLAIALFAIDRYGRAMHVPDADSKRVVIYTTAWCPYCSALRSSLTAARVPFVEYDVEKSSDGALGYSVLGGRGVPISAIGPRVIHGYDVAEIEAALRALGYELAPSRR